MLLGRAKGFKSILKPVFSPISMESLRLQIAQMPISRDLVIFVLTTDDNRQTDHFTPCACAWGKYTTVVLQAIIIGH